MVGFCHVGNLPESHHHHHHHHHHQKPTMVGICHGGNVPVSHDDDDDDDDVLTNLRSSNFPSAPAPAASLAAPWTCSASRSSSLRSSWSLWSSRSSGLWSRWSSYLRSSWFNHNMTHQLFCIISKDTKSSGVSDQENTADNQTHYWSHLIILWGFFWGFLL